MNKDISNRLADLDVADFTNRLLADKVLSLTDLDEHSTNGVKYVGPRDPKGGPCYELHFYTHMSVYISDVERLIKPRTHFSIFVTPKDRYLIVIKENE